MKKTAKESGFRSIKPENIDQLSPIPLYHQIYQQLKRELITGRYSAGNRFFSYRKLKDIYGMELRTIAEAVDLLASEGLVENIPHSGTYVADLEKVRRKGVFVGNFWYILAGNESFEHPFYFKLLKGIERRIDSAGLKLIVGLKESPAKLLEWFTPLSGDGVIITGAADNPALLDAISRRVDGQLVVVGSYKNVEAFPNISIDLASGVRDSLAMLNDISSVGMITGPAEWYSNRLMRDAAKLYARRKNVPFKCEHLASGNDGYDAVLKLKDKNGKLPSCLLVTEPAYMGVCHYLMAQNVGSRGKLKIVRFGKPSGTYYDSFASVNVYEETEALGAEAVKMLLDGTPDKKLFPMNVEINKAVLKNLN